MVKEEFELEPDTCMDLDNSGDTGQVMCNVNGDSETMQRAEAELNGFEFVEE